MKRPTLLIAASIAALVGCATAAIEDTQFGLSKSSVFDDVAPAPFGFDGPGAGQTITPLAGSGIPPMINHPVDSYLPITANANGCLGCHDRPQEIGRKVAKGQPATASASHYAKGADGKLQMSGASYNCLSCHAPQAGVKPLTGNTSR
jgi:nitrate reductase cytochrome c-type subunit